MSIESEQPDKEQLYQLVSQYINKPPEGCLLATLRIFRQNDDNDSREISERLGLSNPQINSVVLVTREICVFSGDKEKALAEVNKRFSEYEGRSNEGDLVVSRMVQLAQMVVRSHWEIK